MEQIIISIVLWTGTAALFAFMLWNASLGMYWAIVFIGRIAGKLDESVNILIFRKRIPTNEWKKIREIALPYISKK